MVLPHHTFRVPPAIDMFDGCLSGADGYPHSSHGHQSCDPTFHGALFLPVYMGSGAV